MQSLYIDSRLVEKLKANNLGFDKMNLRATIKTINAIEDSIAPSKSPEGDRSVKKSF